MMDEDERRKHAYSRLPIHEKIFLELQKPKNLAWIKKRFPGMSYAVEGIMKREEKKGEIERYRERNEDCYKLTKKGEQTVQGIKTGLDGGYLFVLED